MDDWYYEEYKVSKVMHFQKTLTVQQETLLYQADKMLNITINVLWVRTKSEQQENKYTYTCSNENYTSDKLKESTNESNKKTVC